MFNVHNPKIHVSRSNNFNLKEIGLTPKIRQLMSLIIESELKPIPVNILDAEGVAYKLSHSQLFVRNDIDNKKNLFVRVSNVIYTLDNKTVVMLDTKIYDLESSMKILKSVNQIFESNLDNTSKLMSELKDYVSKVNKSSEKLMKEYLKSFRTYDLIDRGSFLTLNVLNKFGYDNTGESTLIYSVNYPDYSIQYLFSTNVSESEAKNIVVKLNDMFKSKRVVPNNLKLRSDSEYQEFISRYKNNE